MRASDDFALLRLERGEPGRHGRAARSPCSPIAPRERGQRQLASAAAATFRWSVDAALREVRRVERGRELAVLLELRRLGDRLDHRLAAHEQVRASRPRWRPGAGRSSGRAPRGAPRACRAPPDRCAPPNMRRSCSCCWRSCSANSRCEMSLPLTVATVSRPPREARVGLDAPGRESDGDQAEEDLHDAPVLLDEIEHRRDLRSEARMLPPRRSFPG